MVEVQEHAVSHAEAAFCHLRRTIADTLGVAEELSAWLMRQHPLDVRSTRRVFQGRYINAKSVEDITRDGHRPALRWQTRLTSVRRDGDSFSSSHEDTFTVDCREGVAMQAERVETRGRPAPGNKMLMKL